jgi:hypothetical protein
MRRGAYLAIMPAPRILRILTLLAVLLMPFGMIGPASPVMAMSHHDGRAMTVDHCAGSAGMGKPRKEDPPGHTPGCMVTCAAIPSAGVDLQPHAMAPSAVAPHALAPRVRGLHPEAAIPPPRFA